MIGKLAERNYATYLFLTVNFNNMSLFLQTIFRFCTIKKLFCSFLFIIIFWKKRSLSLSYLTDCILEEGCRLDQPKHCGNNSSNSKNEFDRTTLGLTILFCKMMSTFCYYFLTFKMVKIKIQICFGQ